MRQGLRCLGFRGKGRGRRPQPSEHFSFAVPVLLQTPEILLLQFLLPLPVQCLRCASYGLPYLWWCSASRSVDNRSRWRLQTLGRRQPSWAPDFFRCAGLPVLESGTNLQITDIKGRACSRRSGVGWQIEQVPLAPTQPQLAALAGLWWGATVVSAACRRKRPTRYLAVTPHKALRSPGLLRSARSAWHQTWTTDFDHLLPRLPCGCPDHRRRRFVAPWAQVPLLLQKGRRDWWWRCRE